MPVTDELVQVWFLFGLSGSGKSYAGDVIAQAKGWPVYHADDDITPAMRRALAESRPFTDAMRDDYFVLLADRIRARQAQQAAGQPLIVTQGAYKRRSRLYLQQQIPGLSLIWIDAPDAMISQRLSLREAGIKPESAAALRQDFECPPPGCLKIVNDSGEDHILAQFETCRGSG
ncbi:MAG: AAA family ATPase [Pseudohongiella sp.]|uniref:AAA family ATPase n=1 Tax=Pseudohongiella sp. TaxID=1979412 RepID=UPI0034A042F3